MEKSAGIICFKKDKNDGIKFFVVHSGGPFNKNINKWGIPKGHIEKEESPFKAAVREFEEETNIVLPTDKYFIDLGEKKQNSKKIIHVFAINYDNFDIKKCFSNKCEIEYPYKSGKKIWIPEIDKYAWKSYEDIKKTCIKGQLSFFDDIITIITNGNVELL